MTLRPTVMSRTLRLSAFTFALAAAAAAVGAQTTVNPAAQAADARRVKESRYQMGQMERLLEGAVEHGASIMRDRLRALLPTDMLLSDNAKARGFRLIGYGVFFDVEVPSLEGTLPWSFRTMDQNGLGLMSAWNAIRSHIESDAANDPNLQQAIKRLDLQVAPLAAAVNAAPVQPGAPVEVRAASTTAEPARAPDQDDVLKDPEEAYRDAVREALMDAMLEHSRGLGVGPTEWLTIAARRNDSGPRLAPVDTEARTIVIKVSGADLTAFLGGQISRDEARRRMDVRVF
jgi:hypothetical protein